MYMIDPTHQSNERAVLLCPIRGPLNAGALAKDGLTPSEEARRVDFLRFLIIPFQSERAI